MPQRRCLVTVTDLDGITHSVEVTAGSVFEAAADALEVFRGEVWAAAALTPTARLRVEVRTPAVVHEVPLQAVERWKQSPTVSPKDYLVKRGSRRP
jgi:hypothetical protein